MSKPSIVARSGVIYETYEVLYHPDTADYTWRIGQFEHNSYFSDADAAEQDVILRLKPF